MNADNKVTILVSSKNSKKLLGASCDLNIPNTFPFEYTVTNTKHA